MSIFRSETVCGNNPITTLHTKIEYILAPGKTIPKYCIALRGNYYSRDYIAMEIAMFQNKRLHGVINGKAYDHFIIRPDSEQDEDLSNETMWAASKAISQYLCNQCPIGRHFLGILALHLDSFDEIPHVHFLIDNIEICTGKRRYFSRSGFLTLQLRINQILEAYNISPIPKKEIQSTQYQNPILYGA